MCKLSTYPFTHLRISIFRFSRHFIPTFQEPRQRMNFSVDPAVYDPRLEAGASLYQPGGSAEAPSAAEEHQRLAVPYFAEIVG